MEIPNLKKKSPNRKSQRIKMLNNNFTNLEIGNWKLVIEAPERSA